MAGEGIYRKTEKGRTEIATRANKLGMRERTLLIMVDDKTSRAGLLSRSAHPASAEILDALLAQGFIEIDPATQPAGAPVASAEPPAAQPVPPVASAVSPTAEAAPGQPQVEVSQASAMRYACRALVTLLGPSADDLTALVEKSRNVGELIDRLEKCRQAIQAMAGKRKAEEFWAGVNARLPKV